MELREIDISDKQQVLGFFVSEPNPDKNGRMKREETFERLFPELYSKFKDFVFSADLATSTFVQRLWHFLHNDNGNLGICPVCGKRTKFQSFTLGYLTYCSSKCANACNDKKDKVAKSWIDRYGGVGYASDKTQEKIKATMLERYGVEYSSQNEAIKQKIIDSETRNFGGVGFASKKITDKFKGTMLERYGVEWASQSDEVTERKRIKKISESDNIIGITDETFVLKYTNPECELCQDKRFEISKKTYLARLSRGNELCTILNPTKTIGKGTSDSEQNLFKFIKSIYGGEIIQNDRTALDGMEIDIYLPEINLGFEFNGDYWHLNPRIYGMDDCVFDRNAKDVWERIMRKEYAANKKGITLVVVWENDWFGKCDEVKSHISDFVSYPTFSPSPYYILKEFLDSLPARYEELEFGHFSFKEADIIYSNAFYFNKSTVHSHIKSEQEKRTIYVYDFEIKDNRKFDILKSVIGHALGLTENKIFARKCELWEITNTESRKFLDENSLFGHRDANVVLGLFHNGELVMVYSFGHNYYGRKDHIEIIRVCTKKNTVVVGGSSKCLKYFMEKCGGDIGGRKIIFYVDRIHNDGKSLKGFKFLKHEYGVMNYWLEDYVGDGFVGMAGTAFNRIPSKHKIIKKLTKLGKIVSIETLGVDVYEYTKPTE